MKFTELVQQKLVFFDGGMGTMIQKHMKLGQLPEELNLTMPEVITGVHRAYLDAGCDVVETDTLNANRKKLARAGLTVEQVVPAAVRNARKAVEEAGHGYVALSMGSTGVMMEPLGDLTFEEAVDMYAEMARCGEQAGADLILIETVSDLHEIKAAVTAAKEATSLPVLVTMTFDENGRTLTGADIPGSVATLEALGVDIVGMNCGLGPKQMRKLVPSLLENASVPVLINPNAGLPKLVDGKNVYAVGAEEFAADAAELAKLGVRLLGGCCGTTPEHIRRLTETLRDAEIQPVMAKNRSIVTSGSRWTELTEETEIGDAGDGDVDDLIDEALDSDADVIRVRYSPLEEAVTQLQETVLTPLYLVAESPAEAEKALRAYNGKPLIGVANRADLAAYIAVAKRGGAALCVSDPVLADEAAAILGAKNVFVDNGDGIQAII